jgi:riboflavin kinase / FMN adenylyltransferase
VKVAHSVAELQRKQRAVALGTFDGVHLGHRRVIETALEAGGTPTVVTFHPHPRRVLGYGVELLTTLERRLELLAELGVEETLVVEFTLDLQRVEAEAFARDYLEPIGARTVVAGPDFRFGHKREGDLELLGQLGFDARVVPAVEGVSSSAIRQLLHDGDVRGAAGLLGRPAEVEGLVVEGDARGGTLGFPTANLAVEPEMLVPATGIYAGFAAGPKIEGKRAAVSIGVNPHYGGHELRVEAFLLGFAGDLYGKRLVVELWRRLRDERAFGSEQELIDQIARDVEQTEHAERPI